jgi:PPOX class probable F420-dependent enzyme
MDKLVLERLGRARVAYLGTTNTDYTSHMVPIVFANDEERIYFVIDKKPKTGKRLQRITNILRTGKASLLLDTYTEDWKNLSFVLIYAHAYVLGSSDKFSKEKEKAGKLLKMKYAQYSSGGYFPEEYAQATFVRLTPARVVTWSSDRGEG